MIKDIYLAGGCFWGVEAYLERINGVIETTVGYANGDKENPKYQEISMTGHVETVHVKYDSSVISLKNLLNHFFKVIDPTSLNKQGNDRGTQYRTGIYYVDNTEKEIIDEFINDKQTELTREIVTEVCPLDNYYLAENYHQDYLKKNPSGYCHINLNDFPEEIVDHE